VTKLKASTLRLPEEIDKKLDSIVKNGKAASKVEIIRRAIDEFLEDHPELLK
jgi:Arc/MetJ-type ribon-helix-helix transcriptional regulator